MSVYREPDRSHRSRLRRRTVSPRGAAVSAAVVTAADVTLGLAVSTLLLLGVAMLVALFFAGVP